MKRIMLTLAILLLIVLVGCNHSNCAYTPVDIDIKNLEFIELLGTITQYIFATGTESEWSYIVFETDEDKFVLQGGHWATKKFWDNYGLNEVLDQEVSIKGYLGKPEFYTPYDQLRPLYITEIEGYSPVCCDNRCFWEVR